MFLSLFLTSAFVYVLVEQHLSTEIELLTIKIDWLPVNRPLWTDVILYNITIHIFYVLVLTKHLLPVVIVNFEM